MNNNLLSDGTVFNDTFLPDMGDGNTIFDDTFANAFDAIQGTDDDFKWN